MNSRKPDNDLQRNPRLSLRSGRVGAARARRDAAPNGCRAFTLIELIVVIGIIVLLTALTVTVAVGVVGKSEQRATANTLKLMDLALAEWETESNRRLTWGVDGEPDLPNQPTSTYDINPDTPQVFDANDATDENSMMNIIINKLRRSEAANDILRQIDGEFLKSEDVPTTSRARYLLLDAWENPVYVVHPGRVADPRTFDPSSYPGLLSPQNNDVSVWKDADGTIRVGTDVASGAWHPLVLSVATASRAWEDILGVCKNRRVCFVSAGPDGQFGNLSADPNGSDDERRLYEQASDNVYSYPVVQP